MPRLTHRHLIIMVGLLIGLGGTVFYLGYMLFASPDLLPGSRFGTSERDLWQRKADWLPPVTAPAGFFLATAALVWASLTRRTRLHWVAWPLLFIVGGFGIIFGWVYVDILTTLPCHEEADDCGPEWAWYFGYPAAYLLPTAALLAVGLWRRRRPFGQQLLAAGVATVIGLVVAHLAYYAVAAWVPPIADDLRGTSFPTNSAVHLENRVNR